MNGPARGSWSISLEGESGDPAQNELMVGAFREFVQNARNLNGGTLFPLHGTSPVSGTLTTNFTNDNGETSTVVIRADEV